MARLLFICIFWLSTSPAKAIELWAVGNTGYQLYGNAAEIPSADNPDWQPFSQEVLTNSPTLWFHQTIDIRLSPDEKLVNPLSLSVRLNGSYSFYFDGKLIGSNSMLGADAPQYSRVLLPISKLTEGQHDFHIRIEAHGLNTGDTLKLNIMPAAVKAGDFGIHLSVIGTFFVAITSLLACLYLTLVWWTRRANQTIATAVLISFCCGLVILIDDGRHLFNLSYLLQKKLDYALPPAAVILLVALPWFVLQQITAKNKLRWMLISPLAFALGAAEILNYEQDIQTFFFLSICLAAISLWHWRKGQISAKFFFVAFCLASILLLADWGKHWYLTLITLMLAGFVARDIRNQSRAALESALATERLRADLIKRNIQPHFLMNSLTVLMEWVETEPNIAVNFIEGLAEEFRLLSQFSEQRSIALDDEIRLCETHVRLMAMRLEADLSFKVSNQSTSLQIPPALFHTLLENAFSHNNYAASKAVFQLDVNEQKTHASYQFSAPVIGEDKAVGSGTGTKYVQARLREFCGSNFTFVSNQVGSSWVTTISIPKTLTQKIP